MFQLFASKRASKSATRVEHQPLAQRIAYGLKYGIFLPFLLLSVLLSWIYLQHHQLFFVKTVKVLDPGLHIDKQQLQQIVEPVINQGFLRFNMQSLRSQLQTLPWVDNVGVERSWPDTLIIRFNEYQPVALWGEHKLLASNGVIFSPGVEDKNRPQLPLVTGPETEAKNILQSYQKMQSLLKPLHLHISEFKVSNRHAWYLTLDNGLVVNLGSKRPLNRLQEFVQIYPDVFADAPKKASYVDLRYDHGMAVKWQ